ncbi:MAG: EamA family transporter [Bacteroidales bacterium]|nr:EamA family transporter [Bacteroidales bacterium]
MNTKAKGYIIGSIAAATYGLNPLFALPLYGAGLDPDSVLFFRYLFSLPILALMIKLRGRNFKLQRKEILPVALMGFLFAISSLTLFQSYNHMAAGIASTLLFVYPIMVALIMAVCFKEELSWTTALCIVLALSGIALLYRGEDGDTLSLVGVALVMASSLSYAIYIVSVNRPMLKNIATLKLMFYGLAFGMLIFLVRLDFGQSLKLVPSDQWYLWGALIALAIFPTVISLGCTTLAIQYIGSTPAAILGALEPLTAVVVGVLVFGEPLTPRLLCGIVLIVAAVTLVVAGGNFTAYLVRFRKMFPKLPFGKK